MIRLKEAKGGMYLDTCLKKETNLGAKVAWGAWSIVCLESGFMEQAYRNRLCQEEPSFETSPCPGAGVQGPSKSRPGCSTLKRRAGSGDSERGCGLMVVKCKEYKSAIG